MPAVVRLICLAAACALAATACTDDSPPQAPSATGVESSSAANQPQELTARQRGAQLAALAPEEFDATYRLDGRGKRPNAMVRMQAAGERFRLDVERGKSAAVLITNRRGVVSCQIEEQGKNKQKQRACFLVANRPAGTPPLFNPQVQRLFRSTTTQISRLRSDVAVKHARDWKAPGDLGNAECFIVKGPEVENGTYCYLAKPGPRIGLLARVAFPSGELKIRSAKRVVRPEAFQAPANPTPLPD